MGTPTAAETVDPFFERILRLEAPGGPAERLSVLAPSVVKPGVPFGMVIAALDAHGYPSVECDGLVHMDHPVRREVRFEAGMSAVCLLWNIVLEREGFVQLVVELDGEGYYSNPILCDADADIGIFWGDPHVHTVLSDCHPDRCRSLDFCFACAAHVTGLDWVCAADHVSNGRSSPGKWKAQREAARRFDSPPEFVTLLGYEASLKGGAGGDNNVYFASDADEYQDAYDDGDLRTLAERLGDQDFIIVPHHTTRTGKHGELSDELYLGRERMPVVEIHSKWGTSEYRGNPNALHEVHPGPSYAQDFLAQGYPFGFIGGTDTHATMPSGYGVEAGHIDRAPGFTAVVTTELSRKHIYEGIRARSCYATCGERIWIECRIGGQHMGSEVEWPCPHTPRRVRANIAAESTVSRVDVVRNGQDVFTFEGDGWQAEVDWTDSEALADVAFPPAGAMTRPFVYYYLRVTCESGAQAWTSPVWLLL